ncbi:CKLF-like MARVEL transmembrane domain-containing protein 4 [Phlebotomus argentipes]|uniref:CKLF-like MARVEL transmembrane domain-containing protein 4 n=1 Tax=Phlebotomus argentipes TaxID=94469 RepID=UPI002893746F|nr:CKLF-like MARVEL transmembrane domain-containing protein 4 [Phlebotomus argentipes]
MPETVVTVDSSQRTTAQPKPASSLSWIQCNVSYFLTLPGLLKLIQLIFGVICMALASPALRSGTHFYLFVVVITFIATLLWCFIYLLGIREVLNLPINWPLTELINTGLASVLYFLAFLVQFITWGGSTITGTGSNIAAGVFGIFNFLAYVAGTYFLYVDYRSG